MPIQTKPDATRILADTDGDKRFFCHDGCAIKNLTELVDCLNHMTEEEFHRHVTSERNDFSNWIRDVIGDEKLATKLNNARSPFEASKIVANKMAWLQRIRIQPRRLNTRR